MKVFVYTISKNEEKNALSFAENMREADEIYVLDTGSADDTVRLLKSAGVNVAVKKYKTFRFDKARNDAMKLMPDEDAICVCPDLDERFEPGWRAKLEAAWTKDAGRARYRYVWSMNPDGSDGVTFITDKIHSRRGFHWIHPVHETLQKTDRGDTVFVNTDIVLRHYPDDTKSRGQYLPLLELACKENPEDDRSAHYLGREYMFHGRYVEAINELKRHLALKSATWSDERCASYRYIAKCYKALNQPAAAESYLMHAAAEAPHLREPLFELAESYYLRGEWHGVLHFMSRAVNLAKCESYITDPKCYGALPYDYLSMAAYQTGDYDAAVGYAEKALTFGEDARIKNNIGYFTAARQRSSARMTK